jgi:hypothetical protein
LKALRRLFQGRLERLANQLGVLSEMPTTQVEKDSCRRRDFNTMLQRPEGAVACIGEPGLVQAYASEVESCRSGEPARTLESGQMVMFISGPLVPGGPLEPATSSLGKTTLLLVIKD